MTMTRVPKSKVVKIRRQGKAVKPSPSKLEDDNTAVIRAAVTYAQNVGAFHAGFDADPSGSNVTASGPLGEAFERDRDDALEVLAKAGATTFAALQAKARVVPFLLQDDQGGEADTWAFIRRFAEDVKKLVEPLVREEEHQADAGAAS
jgi:hypothetical protein